MATDEHTIKLLSAARASEAGSMGVAYRELRARLFERQQAPPRLGRYTLQEHVGAGGMGTVFRAHDPELDRTVAIKLVKSSAVTESSVTELQTEARALARVEHPNVVPVHDLGRYDEGDLSDHAADVLSIPTQGIFIVMRWIDGAPLKQWLRDASPSTAEILQLFEAAGAGLHHVHSCGLVHQDFKPGNVLVDSGNTPHVLDFGIAQVEAQRDPTAPKPKNEDFVRGTPRYMAPEQNRGEPADSRSDQYAFATCQLRLGPRTPDRKRAAQIRIWGGGHADYAGNEVYTFDLDTLMWTRWTLRRGSWWPWGERTSTPGTSIPSETSPRARSLWPASLPTSTRTTPAWCTRTRWAGWSGGDVARASGRWTSET